MPHHSNFDLAAALFLAVAVISSLCVIIILVGYTLIALFAHSYQHIWWSTPNEDSEWGGGDVRRHDHTRWTLLRSTSDRRRRRALSLDSVSTIDELSPLLVVPGHSEGLRQSLAHIRSASEGGLRGVENGAIV